MPIHPDWQKVLDAMIKRYGKKKGESVFYATMKKRGVDYTKPAPKKQGYFHFPITEWRKTDGIIEKISDVYIEYG